MEITVGLGDRFFGLDLSLPSEILSIHTPVKYICSLWPFSWMPGCTPLWDMNAAGSAADLDERVNAAWAYIKGGGLDIARGAINIHTMHGKYGYKKAVDKLWNLQKSDSKAVRRSDGFPTGSICEMDDQCKGLGDYCSLKWFDAYGDWNWLLNSFANFFNALSGDEGLGIAGRGFASFILGKECRTKKDLGAVCHTNEECGSGLCGGLLSFLDAVDVANSIPGHCSDCENLNSDEGCSDGMFCEDAWNNLDIGLRCAPKYAFGAPCFTDDMCKDGHCNLFFCSKCPELHRGTGCPGHQYCEDPLWNTNLGKECVDKKDPWTPGCFHDDMCKDGNCIVGVC